MMADATARERRLRAGFVRRAIETGAPLLASPLDRYVRAEETTWTDLARSLGCDQDGLHRIACCRPPRDDRFLEDVAAIAACGPVDPDRLLPLLRHLQVLAAFADRSPASMETYDAGAVLLAARDREETEERESRRGEGEDDQTRDPKSEFQKPQSDADA